VTSLTTAQGHLRLDCFLRDHQPEILSAWEELLRSEPVAGQLSKWELRDHLPALLNRIAEQVESQNRSDALQALPDLHALARLDLGFDLRTLVTEYKLLRSCVLKLYKTVADGLVDLDELEHFNASIDDAIRLSVAQYATVRGRTLLALDQFSLTALGNDDVHPFLRRLLEVVVGTVDAVDMGAIFLWRDDALHVQSSVGMMEDFPELALRLGEGFAGAVASRGTPLALRCAGKDSAIKPRGLPADTKALYGVPLLDRDQLVGVMYMGSRTAYEFAPEDTVLLRVIASRATASVVESRLRQAEATERKRAQEAEARLTQAAEVRETFLGVLSHDLRNLVSTIGGTAQALLADAHLTPEMTKRVSRIARVGERMGRMIRDLLDFTRGRLGGGIPVTPKPTDVGVICGQVVDEVRASHPDRDFQLRTHGDLRGVYDPDRLTQAVMNLCANADEYGAPRTPVEVSATRGGESIEIAVKNAGDPVESDEMERLFEPYHSRSETGLGLGLFIVREVARAHGGTVDAEHRDAHTVFTIRLPRAPGLGDTPTS